MTTLKPERKAPKFSATIQTGEQVKLEDYRGKKLILFFYPKDNTPTCTVEACNLRDNFSKLKKEGFQLLGVSPDSEKKHNNFINKFDLPFDLIADTDLKVIKAYKCWGLKKFMGREFEGVYRTTFVIDEEGKLELVITKVKSKDHTNQILELLAAV